MDLDPELVREWIGKADRLAEALDRLPRRASDGVTTQAGNIIVKVEDGKTPKLVLLAVFSAALCAVLSVVTLINGVNLYLNMKDHLDAIYMMAPQLKQGTDHVDHHPDPTPQEVGHQHDHQ